MKIFAIVLSFVSVVLADESFNDKLQAYGRELFRDMRRSSQGIRFFADRVKITSEGHGVVFQLFYVDANGETHHEKGEHSMGPGSQNGHWYSIGSPSNPESIRVRDREIASGRSRACAKLVSSSTAPVKLYATVDRPFYTHSTGWIHDTEIVTVGHAELTASVHGRQVASIEGEGTQRLELPGTIGAVYQGCVQAEYDDLSPKVHIG